MTARGSLLLVDDDRHVLESTADWLRSLGHRVVTARGVAEARQRLAAGHFDLAVSDIRLDDGTGFDVLAACRSSGLRVILVTGYGSLETGIEALRAGAFDLLTKPLLDDELEQSIARALWQKNVVEENKSLKAQLDLRVGLENLVGRDPRMDKIYELIDCVADTRATVLVTGESGTGKSLVARAIHRRSSRRDRPFVEVACGALPEPLLESELFGHVAGAFTGALGNKMGRFQQADGGTLFLDEIGTASPALQVKLLRVLQELAFEPVGSSQTVTVETRVILATNEELSSLVAAGKFRQDLFYRINVVNIELPPLRERTSDIPVLARHFLARSAEQMGRSTSDFADDALAALVAYRWPGNVRELENVVERAVLLGKSSLVRACDLPVDVARAGRGGAASMTSAASQTLKEALEGPERSIILETLARYEWNRHQTADALGINRTTLYKKMKRLGLETEVA